MTSPRTIDVGLCGASMLAALVSLPFADARTSHAPDLVVETVDVSRVDGDWQELTVSGTVHVALRNAGDLDVPDDFVVAVFEDLDRSGTFDGRSDLLLAEVQRPALAALASGAIDAPISATVAFRGDPIWAYVDSRDTVAEFSERNNANRSGVECRAPNDPEAMSPDLTVSRIIARRLPGPEAVELSARIGNGGTASEPPDVPIRFAAGTFAGRAATSQLLAPGAYEDVHVVWSAPGSFNGTVTVAIGVGDEPWKDCDSENDRFSRWLDLAAVPPPVAFRVMFLPYLEVQIGPERSRGARRGSTDAVRPHRATRARGGTR